MPVGVAMGADGRPQMKVTSRGSRAWQGARPFGKHWRRWPLFPPQPWGSVVRGAPGSLGSWCGGESCLLPSCLFSSALP